MVASTTGLLGAYLDETPAREVALGTARGALEDIPSGGQAAAGLRAPAR